MVCLFSEIPRSRFSKRIPTQIKIRGLLRRGMNTKLIKKYCLLEDEAKELLKMAMTELELSTRAYDKILKVSRTIVDLVALENI